MLVALMPDIHISKKKKEFRWTVKSRYITTRIQEIIGKKNEPSTTIPKTGIIPK